MNVEEFREYCIGKDGVTEKTPFGKFAWRYDSLLVFYVLEHMFCLVDMDDFTWVTVKCDPERIEELRSVRASVSKPVNLSERHWIQIDLNGDVKDGEVYELVDRAYEIVKAKYSPKKRICKK